MIIRKWQQQQDAVDNKRPKNDDNDNEAQKPTDVATY